jgi:hypothetical protein
MGGNHHLQMVGLLGLPYSLLNTERSTWLACRPNGSQSWSKVATKVPASWDRLGGIREFPTALKHFLNIGWIDCVRRQRRQPGFGTQPDLSCEPHEINCCGLHNSSPCLEEDTCTILYLYGDDQNIKVWVCESWFGFVRVYLGIPHQFQVHSLSWMCFLQCPNKHLVWCLSVIKRDIPRGVVQISGVKHIRRSEGRIPHAMPNTWHSLCTFWWNTEPINQIESCRE